MGKNIAIKNIIYNDSWDFKYIEKKKNEFGLYIYLSVELKNFLNNFLKLNGLSLHNYKINIQELELKIFLSYLKSPKLLLLLNNLLKLQKIQISKKSKNKFAQEKNNFCKILTILKNRSNFKKTLKSKKYILKFFKIYYNKVLYKKFKFYKKILICHNKYNQHKQFFKLLKYLIKKKKLNYTNKNYLFKYCYKNKNLLSKIKSFFNHRIIYQQNLFFFNKFIKKRFKNLKKYKLYYQMKLNKLFKTIKINNFLEKFIESLNIFLQNKFSIKIYFYQLSKDIYYLLSFHQRQIIKKIIVQLRQFQTLKLFREGVNLLFFVVIKKNSAQLLANFIALHLKSKKNHNIFFRFLNQTLLLLLTNQISKIKSIKILIKGRFNKASRSKKKIIFVGNKMSLMSFNSLINYSKATSYSRNGTIGIKVWIYE